MLNVYKNQKTGSRNLMGPKTVPTIWDTYMKRVTKYQISVINSCCEKCDEKCAYMFNVYKNQLSRQTGSRNLMGPSTITEKNATKNILDGRKNGRTDRRTEVKQYTKIMYNYALLIIVFICLTY